MKNEGQKSLTGLRKQKPCKNFEGKWQKIELWILDRSKWERKSFEKVWIVIEHVKTQGFKKLYVIFDWSKMPSIDPTTIEHQSKWANSNEIFNHNFDRSSNKFDQSKIWKNQIFEK